MTVSLHQGDCLVTLRGSTGKAALREGFGFIGCEMSPEYMAIASARIEAALAELYV